MLVLLEVPSLEYKPMGGDVDWSWHCNKSWLFFGDASHEIEPGYHRCVLIYTHYFLRLEIGISGSAYCIIRVVKTFFLFFFFLANIIIVIQNPFFVGDSQGSLSFVVVDLM